MTSSRTLGVTIGIGPDYAGYAAETAARVRKHLGLETVILGDEALDRVIDLSSRSRSIWSLKFSLFDLVPNGWERLMYFDADWRPVRDWDVDALFPDMQAIYVAPDLNHRRNIKEMEAAYGLVPGSYFNSGWMLLPARARSLLDEAKRRYPDLPKRLGDQCVLNQVLRNEVTRVSEVYNICEPLIWPDPANAMAVHPVNSDWNFDVYRGIAEDRIWEPVTYPNPNETILRGLVHGPADSIGADHLVEIAQAAMAYGGGRALAIAGGRGLVALALGLGGLSVTSASTEGATLHVRKELAARHGLDAVFRRSDVDDELLRDERLRCHRVCPRKGSR